LIMKGNRIEEIMETYMWIEICRKIF